MGVKANEEDTTNHRCEKASTRTQTLATWPAVASNRADNQAQAANHTRVTTLYHIHRSSGKAEPNLSL